MPDKEKVIKAWECCNPFNRKCKECPYEKDCYHDGISMHMVADAISLLKEQPEIVRCKDCKYGEPWGVLIGCGTTKGFGITHGPDWFCADGERRTDDA